jgi:hypothetical protein
MILTQVLVVSPDATVVVNHVDADTKYWYPESQIPVSVVADHTRLNVPGIVVPLTGLTRIEVLGAIVSRYTDSVVLAVSLPVKKVTYSVLVPLVPVVRARLYNVHEEKGLTIHVAGELMRSPVILNAPVLFVCTTNEAYCLV